MLGDSLGSTDVKVLGCDEGIKMGLSYSEVISIILGNVGGIKIEIDVGIVLGSLDRSFDKCNDGKLEVLLLGDSLGSADDKVIGSDEGIKLGLFDS